MRVHTFIADTAFAAVEQIRAELGPGAVVLNVRQLPADGLSRLWKKPRIEVLATLPEAGSDVAQTEAAVPEPGPSENQIPSADPFAELREELAQIRAELNQRERRQAHPGPVALPPTPEPPSHPAWTVPAPEFPSSGGLKYPGDWRVGPMLEASGILPVYSQRILEHLCSVYGDQPPEKIADELELTARMLRGEWTLAGSPVPGATKAHVFVGPTATGKTTFLSKWLARAVLLEGQSASVWRLDGRTSNTAQSLSVYGEILGVPVERFIPEGGHREPDELLFIDLPGIAWNEAGAIQDLNERLRALGPVQVHLVLNLAYETPVLLAQARAFALLPIQDLVLTHLDEEPRWQKAWNLVLGTNFSLGFLSVGQNVPGEWFPATPDRILMRPLSRV